MSRYAQGLNGYLEPGTQTEDAEASAKITSVSGSLSPPQYNNATGEYPYT